MKQKVKPVKKTTQSKKPTQFSIEMDAKGIGFFLIMGLGAALIVFYLGYTYGKATRDPNAVPMVQTTLPTAEEQATEADVQKNLKIYNVREDGAAKMEELRKSSEETLNDASRIIAESRQDKAARVATVKKTEKQPAAAKKEPEFTPQWPEKVKKNKSREGLYTYQIFATRDIQKATFWVKHLRERGFDAKKEIYESGDTRLYRVRVGRGTKAEMKKIEAKLKKAVAGETPTLRRYGK